MIENKNIYKRNGAITSSLKNLLGNLASVLIMIDAADQNSAFGSKIHLIIDPLLPIIKEGLKEKPEEIDIDLMVVNIKQMNQLVIRQKATNPLVPDELVTMAMEAERMVIDLQALLDESTNKGAIE